MKAAIEGGTEEARSDGGGTIVPGRAQPGLPLDRLLLEAAPGEEAVPLDVCIVGGGPAGLATALELTRLAEEERAAGNEPLDLEIGVLEKAGTLGEHCLSGAVVDPGPFRTLFPELGEGDLPFRGPVRKDRVYLLTETRKLRLPAPPTMRNHGNHVASICEVVRWLGERAEERGVNVFTGFPADSLLLDGDAVVGVRTTPAGLDREGNPGSGYMPATDLVARVTVLAEGTRGALTQAWFRREGIGSANPQIYALGVKELWRVKRPLEAVIHTLGWPLPPDAFGGSWIYPMAEDLVSLGLVVGLDYPQRTLDIHVLLQRMKEHPLLVELLEGGELLEWGGKTIPEGGYWSIPERLHGDGLLVVGDSAGFVDVASLKGIHYAMQSGILAARAIYRALKTGDATGASPSAGGGPAAGAGGSAGAGPISAAGLAAYERSVRGSFILEDLYRTRNMRLAFRDGLYRGGIKAGLMQLSRGALLGRRIRLEADADVPREPSRPPAFAPDGRRTFSKVDAVFRSGNATRDDIPSHLLVGEEVSPEMAEFYQHMCPAGVYERQGDRLVVNPPNCIDCKATDVLGPRWTPREGGSGPAYKRM